MTPIILEDELAAKRYSYFQQRFRLEGFGSTPDLTLREPPPAYVENPADDVGITFGDDKPAEGDEEHYLTGWKLFGLMLAITMACFLVLLDMSVIVTAIPKITTHFHSLSDVGWYGAAYNLCSAALQPISGKFYTYFKSKWTFLSFLLVFLLGSLVCGMATSSLMFIVGRAVAGMGSSGLQNGAMTIIAASAPMEKRPALMGMMLGGCQIGLAAGPLVGGALTQYTSWRWCFYINFPIGGVAAAVIMAVTIPDRRIRKKGSVLETIKQNFDLTGFALFVPWAIMILLALEYGGNQYPWNSSHVIGLFIGGALTFAVWFWWEKRKGEGAMIPFPIVKKKEIWTSCLSMLFLFTTIFAASYFLPIYFQSVKGATPFKSGLYMLPSILSQLVFAVASGFLSQKVGYYMPFALLSGVVLAIGYGLMTTFSPHTAAAEWIGYQIFVGFGRGMSMQIPLIAIQANTAPEFTAIATATLVFSQTFGCAVFIAIANALFNNTLKTELGRWAPGTDALAVIEAGATGIRSVVRDEGDVPGVLMAYSKGVDAVFYLVVGMAVCMFAVSWGMGWKDIRSKEVVPAKRGDGEAGATPELAWHNEF
ncbi:hypothetical protein PLICBS_000518 [Purpureocillium lilacinum]|uniref:uncharacterized protein n=1 Tax=Purpureocillium lilacinum TaxID=33203 RepID=UPI0020828490|nr:hypothetical protein PLICBS_000518 [Purpureocillium lilacinum]